MIPYLRADKVKPFADSKDLAKNNGSTLIDIGTNHRPADPDPLTVMSRDCEENK